MGRTRSPSSRGKPLALALVGLANRQPLSRPQKVPRATAQLPKDPNLPCWTIQIGAERSARRKLGSTVATTVPKPLSKIVEPSSPKMCSGRRCPRWMPSAFEGNKYLFRPPRPRCHRARRCDHTPFGLGTPVTPSTKIFSIWTGPRIVQLKLLCGQIVRLNYDRVQMGKRVRTG